MTELERVVRAEAARVAIFEAIKDHIPKDYNIQGDDHAVRQALNPLRDLARDVDLTPWITLHSNKALARLSLRERAAGSGGLTDMPRSALFAGYHPTRRDDEGRPYRAVAVGKVNRIARPAALVFRIDGREVRDPETNRPVVNPSTGEIDVVGVVDDLTLDPELMAEEISPQPPREEEETTAEAIERWMAAKGSNGEWRRKRDARNDCAAEGVTSASNFDNEYPRLDERGVIETEMRAKEGGGREWWWRIATS